MPRNGLDDCLSLGRGGQDAIPLKAPRWYDVDQLDPQAAQYPTHGSCNPIEIYTETDFRWADNGDCRIMACSQEKRGGTTVPVLQPELGIGRLTLLQPNDTCSADQNFQKLPLTPR